MSELGEFLRSRRDAVDPSSAGIVGGLRRRVSGLRREEVAALAGMHVDYYRRIEQGRETGPSLQVADALARALRLRSDEREHLLRLAGLLPPVDAGRREVAPGLLRLLDQWPAQPAFVLDAALNVLASNPLARALHRGFADPTNLARMVFADPSGRVFYLDWEHVAEDTAANLRLGRGRAFASERVDALIAELARVSPDFQRVWGRNDVLAKTRARKRLQHPDVGLLVLDFETLHVEGAGDQYLLIYHAARGTASDDSLRMLGALSAPATTAPI